VAEILTHPAVREHVVKGLATLATKGRGSSTYAGRALMLTEPPSVDAGEVTDKGYINQRAVLSRRSSAVECLYRTPADPAVFVLSPVNGGSSPAPHRSPS
jgi:feruloyl-CoA synthase